MLAIIRITPGTTDKIPRDEKRLHIMGFPDLQFKIPQVRVLKRSVHNEDVFEFKPLLFNYGFIDIPMNFLKNPTRLAKIRDNSEVISGFFYRKASELQEERVQRELDGLPDFAPVLVKTIEQEQLDLLYEEAKRLDVYQGSESLSPGSFVVLQKYPFEGLAAKVDRKKTNGRIQVTLLDSGLTMWLDIGSILYTPYSEPDSYNY